MNALRRIVVFGLLTGLLAACPDLEVENLNEPDREQVLASPGDVEALIAGSFYTWSMLVDQDMYGAALALSVMADETTDSWGNAGMLDASQEPRQAIPNDPEYVYAFVFENPWYRSYAAITAARDGLIAIAGADGQLFTDDDLEIGVDGVDNARAITFAKFVVGLAHGTLGLLYDRAFTLDETTDLEELVNLPFEEGTRPYGEVASAAVAQLEEAIELASANSFTIPSDWVGSYPLDSDGLIRVAHSYAARILASWPRWPSERENEVEWGEVLSHANQGIDEDFWLMGDGLVRWESFFKLATYHWSKADLRMLGPAGSSVESNQRWRDWEETLPGGRLPFDIDSDDFRMPAYPSEQLGPGEVCPERAERTSSCGYHFVYTDPRCNVRNGCFNPARGTYHYSAYQDWHRHGDYAADAIGPIIMLDLPEMDLLKGESLIRLEREAEALPLINAYREGYGQLPPVTVSGAPELAGRCTPRTLDGSCAGLMEALKYEKRMEVYATGMGVAFWDDRGWGDLLTGTPLQFPIPAKELLTLLQEIYTFGGSCDGDPAACGGAPDIVAWGEGGGGLRPLNPGDVPSAADIAARVRLFQAINVADRDPRSLRQH